MTFRGTLRRCFVWLLCLSLCLGLAVPVLAEDNTGTEIRLLQTEGTVNVSSTSGKTYSTREDMRLYSGYVVSTEEASYAWITLDAEKAVKLDECSSLEVRRSGKSLELLLKSGEMYCDVTAPLKEDEKLNIRTSTMVTGVRGTIVYIQKISDDETHLGVLEGRAQGVAINPVTGATRALMVRQGQIGVFKVYDADEAGEGADAWLLGMKVDDIPPFVQVQIAQDPAARDRVPKDLQKTLTEALQDLLKKQAETRQKLEEIEELKEEEVISKDPLWEGEQGGDTGSYTITWNIDGRTETTTCKAGTTPGHAAPAKAGYIFIGWSPELAPAEADAAYTAIYIPIDSIIVGPEPQPEPEPEPERYTITWLDEDGETVLGTTEAAAGEVPAFGDEPTKEATAQYTYTFAGWDPEPVEAAGEASYTATFEATLREYTITWVDGVDNSTIDTTTVAYGEMPTHADPTKAEAGGFRYTFAGWDRSFEAVTGETSYTAQFTSAPLYAVNLQQPTKNNKQSGTLEANVQTAAAGDTVTVTLTPNAGYEVNEVILSYTVNGVEESRRLEAANDGTYSFEMPASDVTVEAMLAALQYEISYQLVPDYAEEEVRPTVTVNGIEADQAQTDDTVTVTFEWPIESYRLDSVTVAWSDGTNSGSETLEPTEEDTVDFYTTHTYTFNMPAGNAVINIKFSQYYEVITEGLYGKVNCTVNGIDPDSEEVRVTAGERVTLQVVPTGNYVMATNTKPYVTYYDEASGADVAAEVTAIGNNTFTFTMPEAYAFVNLYGVTVQTSDPANTTTLVVSTGGEDFNVLGGQILLVNPGAAVRVEVATNEAEGYMIRNTSADPAVTFVPDTLEVTEELNNTVYNSIYSFTMPETDVEMNIVVSQG